VACEKSAYTLYIEKEVYRTPAGSWNAPDCAYRRRQGTVVVCV